ncbi:MAG: Asp-tRNA(Asn)/Glu-tRNA(Gln) amidotransferase subunit GatB [Nanoarchaeota archaeon]|nr:Asp-tRNA(Asn)/Glu-tRNA(Gln) amidotransferase subunit GatB [Nanoarchaeota archaeon]
MSLDTPVKIGLETHVQLNSTTKMFCGCKNPIHFEAAVFKILNSKSSKASSESKMSLKLKDKAFHNMKAEAFPNTITCPICLGLPGSKPNANRRAFELAAKVSIALGCDIAKETYFSRKTYFYPDMAKNFQITQYEIPLAKDGTVEMESESGKKQIRIRRIHMEEDPAKLVHVGGLGGDGKHVLMDYNRSGIPLIEIVTEPDFKSPKEARLYINKLATVLEYLGVYDSSSEASIKTDANISIAGGERVEVKNISGAKEVERALAFEYMRQKNVVARGGKIVQETRAWDDVSGTTKALRKKETEEEYGYIFEPDLPKLEVSESFKKNISSQIPELPDAKRKRLIKQYKIAEKTAESIVSSIDLANLFESAAKTVKVEIAAAWISERLMKTLNYNSITWKTSGLKQEWIIDLLKMFESGKYSDDVAERILWKMIDDRLPPLEAAKRHGLSEIDRSLNLEKTISGILAKNAKAVEDYKNGGEKSLNFLIGQLMRETKGAVDAKNAREKIIKMVKKFPLFVKT